ncbi:MAG: hypothetical protein D3925_02180 [Candidatus Electrothrix sp. AR5]|nr:hypothetical protein [Candidatus Electrothrix sp. AR5]
MKKIILRFVFGLTVGLIISSSASAATQVDTNTIEAAVDRFITEMQQETIKQNFSAMLLKNEMRPKMMAERVPQNFMQSTIQPVIQPVMTEKIRAQIQAQQTEVITSR